MKISELIERLEAIEDKDEEIELVVSDNGDIDSLSERTELKYVEHSEYEGWQIRGIIRSNI